MSNIQSIQVLGSGCPTCKKLFELTKQAASELGIEIKVEYLEDIQKIIDLGLMSSPVLVVNNQAILRGQVPDLEKIKELLSSQLNKAVKKEEDCCSCCCGGKC